MARLRSPGYPSFDLEHSIDFARRIHEADRQHPVAREVAAKHMGFTGPSGTSDRALSALMHYGLAERHGKGEIRVTDLALSALHAHSDGERRSAYYQAGFSPDLFRELHERYPEGPPSLGSLSSYLSRENFAPAAIPSAAKAYLETCYFLQREGAYEIGPEAGLNATEPSDASTLKETSPVQSQLAAPLILGGHSMTPPSAAQLGRRDVFTLGEDGEVVVILPTTVTHETYEDLQDWLALIGRKVGRRIAQTTQSLSKENGERKE